MENALLMRKLRLGDTCKNGHVLTEANIMLVSGATPRLRCGICIRNAVDRYYYENGGRAKRLRSVKAKREANLEEFRAYERARKRIEYARNPEKFASLK